MAETFNLLRVCPRSGPVSFLVVRFFCLLVCFSASGFLRRRGALRALVLLCGLQKKKVRFGLPAGTGTGRRGVYSSALEPNFCAED